MFILLSPDRVPLPAPEINSAARYYTPEHTGMRESASIHASSTEIQNRCSDGSYSMERVELCGSRAGLPTGGAGNRDDEAHRLAHKCCC